MNTQPTNYTSRSATTHGAAAAPTASSAAASLPLPATLAELPVSERAFAGHQQIADVAPSTADRATESRRASRPTAAAALPPPPGRRTAGGARGDKKESRAGHLLPPPPIMQNIFRTTFRANFIVLWPSS